MNLYWCNKLMIMNKISSNISYESELVKHGFRGKFGLSDKLLKLRNF